MGLELSLEPFLVPVWTVLLGLPMRWRHPPATGLGAQSLVAGIAQDLHRGPVGQELDQPSWRAWVMSARLAGRLDSPQDAAFER
ncbi:hypothetical protein [Streptomyces albipurpureus]|uniref:Uncharacterized protein n=1 Tax=Streptomyces albipurpureus TaxID=2897419 RepID=A0ABT0UFT9_9ACTN|nr:hypothetical protein [Streptomyces sp. CWNU-1]MCM2387492.1 hypothetical protein [Streptomyces sp. CWNU-1]